MFEKGIDQPRHTAAESRPQELTLEAAALVNGKAAGDPAEAGARIHADPVEVRNHGITVHAERVQAVKIGMDIRPVSLQGLAQFPDFSIAHEHPRHVTELDAVKIGVPYGVTRSREDVRGRVHWHARRVIEIELRLDQLNLNKD